MSRVLIVPAAGMGTRLRSDRPKLLHPVLGRPMVDHLLGLYAPFVEEVLLVIHPSFETEVRRHLDNGAARAGIAFQREPTGMLAAILEPRERVAALAPDWIWITWCDQIGIHPRTAQNLATAAEREPPADLALPTVERDEPYIHFERDRRGHITRVLQAREGDPMPARGESDSGLFCLSRASYLERLPEFARSAPRGQGTGEVNFLPFVPWIARDGLVRTFPLQHAAESIGINTREEQQRVERYLRERD